MPTNDFLPFCPTDTGTNLPTQSAYAADTQRTNGNQPGIASSKLVNKALRQATWIASQFAQYISNITGNNVLDDENSTNILATMSAALTSGSNVVSKTSAYTAALKDFVILSSASWSLTLPDATTAGAKGLSITLQHNGTSLTQVYTILTTSGQTINGPGGAVSSGNYALYTNGETLTVISNGVNWTVLGHRTSTPWVNAGAAYITASSAYSFTVTAANATVGAKYSNAGSIFTVTATITGGTTLLCAGTGTPGASGTLTKTSGTGDATITFSARTITGVPAKGTVVTDNHWWRREGQELIGRYELYCSAAGTLGLGGYMVSPIATIDTTLLAANNNFTVVLAGIGNTGGIGDIFINTSQSGGTGSGKVLVFDQDYMKFFVTGTSNGNGAVWGAISGANFGSFSNTTCGITFTYRHPVVGWQP